MSAGHLRHHDMTAHDHQRWSDELLAYLHQPKFEQALSAYTNEDDQHDIPYGGGSDNEGHTVFFDRHLVAAIKAGLVLYDGKPFDPRPYIKIHEAVEGALIRLFGLDYDHAHLIATAAERQAVEHHGLDWGRYSKSFAKFIKGDEHEAITDPPRNLLLEAYKGPGGSVDNPMIQKLIAFQKQPAPDGQHYIADGRRPGKYHRVIAQAGDHFQ